MPNTPIRRRGYRWYENNLTTKGLTSSRKLAHLYLLESPAKAGLFLFDHVPHLQHCLQGGNIASKKRHQSGFTLIESMISLAIVEVLAVFAIPQLTIFLQVTDEGGSI